MRCPSRPAAALFLALLALIPSVSAQSAPHENFQRATPDPAALDGLGATLVKLSETSITAILANDDVNATRAAKLTGALTGDLPLIASLSDVGSASLLEPFVGPYTRISSNLTNITHVVAAIRITPVEERYSILILARGDVQGMYGDADVFEGLGHDVTRLRQLLGELLDDLALLQASTPPPPDPVTLILVVDPSRVPLGRMMSVRAVIDPPQQGIEIRFALDGAPWHIAKTDEKGELRFARQIAMDARLGNHDLRAEAAVAPRPSFANVTFEVVRIPTIITLSGTLAGSGDIVVRGRIRDDLNAPLGGAEAIMTLGPNSTDITFASDGSLALRIPAENVGTAEVVIVAYAGNATQAPATARARWDRAAGIGDPSGPGAETRTPTATEKTVTFFKAAPEWIAWPIAILLLVGAEVFVMRLVRARPHFLMAKDLPAAQRAAIRALAPTPSGIPWNDPGHIVLLAYRDLLVKLAREGVPIEAMTHREIAGALLARGYDAEAVEEVTQLFEEVRYAATSAPAERLRQYLPHVVRLLKTEVGA